MMAGDGWIRPFTGGFGGKTGDHLSAVFSADPLAGLSVTSAEGGHTAIFTGGPALKVVGASGLTAGDRWVGSFA